ncbi:Kynurenine formamidase, bacterial [Minicystis rosea]|nr:Kynurenine formamidase, bacterial [Minicystis rosea]
MRLVISILAVLAVALSSGCATEHTGTAVFRGAHAGNIGVLDGMRLVDLTYPFDERTIYWPTATKGFVHDVMHHGKTEGGYFYSAYSFCAPEHGGTHLDAPIHFAEGKATVDTIPLSRLVAPAVVVDVAASAAKDADYRVTAADVEAFEKAYGAIEPGTIVLFHTGWGARWPDKKRYLGDDRPGHIESLHFPGIGEDAARALVARKVAAVGLDTASLDHGPSKDFIAHRVLLGAEIPGFENIAALETLPPRGALVLALPMKIGAGSGAPLRIVALLLRRE